MPCPRHYVRRTRCILQSDTLHIELVPEEKHISSQYKITAGPRINIDYAEEAVHYPWRFYYEGHPFVSKK